MLGATAAAILGCLFSHLRRRTFAGRRKIYSSTTRLGKTDGGGLLRVARAVFAFPDVLNLFAHELAGLGRGGFTFPSVFVSALNGAFLGHTRLLPG